MGRNSKEYKFQSYTFCPANNALRNEHDEVVILEQRVADLLNYLCQNPNQILRKDLILSEVWAGRIVNEDSLSVAVSKLRKHLRDSRNEPEYLKTIPGVGYQWLQPVEVINETPEVQRKYRFFWLEKKPALSIALLLSGVVIVSTLVVQQLSVSGRINSNTAEVVLSERATESLRIGQKLVNTAGEQYYRDAIVAFREVLDEDPLNKAAHIGIVRAKLRLSALNGYMDYPLYKDENRAILDFVQTIDEDYAPLWEAKAHVAFVTDWDLDSAVSFYEKAIQLNPENSRLYLGYSELLITMGKFDQAEAQLRELRRRDPSLYRYLNLAYVYMMRGDYERALAETQRLVNTEATSRSHFHMLQRLGVLTGNDEMAFDSLQVLMRQQKVEDDIVARVNEIYASEGLTEVFRYFADAEIAYNLGHFIPPLSTARYHVITGDYSKALAKIREAIDARQLQVLMLKVDPFYAPLHNEAEYTTMVEELNL